MKFSTRSSIYMSLVTGVLLWASWPSSGIGPLLFISLVPLFLIEYQIRKNSVRASGKKLFLYSYIAFFTFNLLTTWWIYFASLFGVCMALFFNSLFMAVIFVLAHLSAKKMPSGITYLPFIAYWTAFEYLHMNWELSWPWLSFGNGFAAWYKIVQWYEYTGILGGTLWVLISNILFTKAVVNFTGGNLGKSGVLLRRALLFIMIPVAISFLMYTTYEESPNPVNVAVIQPNIDPYNEKFSGMSSADQLQRILTLADSIVDAQTDYLVAPETALPDGIWENRLDEHPHILQLREFMKRYPDLHVIIGMASNYYYEDSLERSATARQFLDGGGYYDSYNTALYIGPDGETMIHHKSKLVPGVERLPFPWLFRYFERFAIDLGGTTGSLGMQEEPTVFADKSGRVSAPVICYESVYGDYLAEYIRKGASVITIITNDGWWSDTPGYRQHLTFASLRAIEMRRSVARSANTGISCFVNQRGDIIKPTGWWVPVAIRHTINANTSRTIYSRTGDLPGILSLWISAGVLVLVLTGRRSR